MKRLIGAALLAAAAWIWRAKLVAVLTATTGTWVGSPRSPRSDGTQAVAGRSSAGASSLAPEDGSDGTQAHQ